MAMRTWKKIPKCLPLKSYGHVIHKTKNKVIAVDPKFLFFFRVGGGGVCYLDTFSY